MQRKLMLIGFTLAVVCLVLGGYVQSQAQQRKGQPKPQSSTTGTSVPGSSYQLSGPFTHKNLTVFLVHGANQSGQTKGRTYLTLQEAMRQKKVVVRETGDVNELTIQNRSTEEVFVQAGDIVKGGQQDRVLALDLILPPKSGRIPIDAFCVEQSRWSQRGQEAVTAFSASEKMLATKGLKLAARNSQSQSEVWANVSVAQAKLAKNYVAAKGVPGGVPGGVVMGAGNESSPGRRALAFDAMITESLTPAAPPPPKPPAAAERTQNAVSISPGVLSTARARLTLPEQQGLTAVTSHASPTSLQLTLENKNVKDSSAAYVKQLASIIAGKQDVIGYVFAINGQLNSADIYASNALFAKLWPKLLEASAVEAFAELDESEKFEPTKDEAAKAFLRDAESGKAEIKTLQPRTRMVKRETEKNVFFEARDRARNDAWVHRNYLAK